LAAKQDFALWRQKNPLQQPQQLGLGAKGGPGFGGLWRGLTTPLIGEEQLGRLGTPETPEAQAAFAELARIDPRMAGAPQAAQSLGYAIQEESAPWAIALNLLPGIAKAAQVMKRIKKPGRAALKATKEAAEKAKKAPLKPGEEGFGIPEDLMGALKETEKAPKGLPEVPTGKRRLYRWEGKGARKAGAAAGREGGDWFESVPGAYRAKGAKGSYIDVTEREFRHLQADPKATEVTLPPEMKGRVKPITPTRPAPAAGGIPAKPAEELTRKDLININPKYINSGDDLDAAIKQNMHVNATTYKKQIDDMRRKGFTWESIDQYMAASGADPRTISKLMKRKKGAAYSAEELFALRDANISASRHLQEAAQVIRKGDDSTNAMVNFRKALDLQYAIQLRLHGATAEAGRALQQFQKMAKGGVPREAVEELLQGGINKKNLREVVESIADMKWDPAAQGKFVGKVRKPKFWDKVFELTVASMLSSLKTFALNIDSSAMFKVLRSGEREIQAGIEVATRVKVRGAITGEGAVDMYKTIGGIKEGFWNALRTLATEESAFGKKISAIGGPEVRGKFDFRHTRAIKGVKGQVLRVPYALLGGGDDFIKTMAANGDAWAWAYRKAVSQLGFKAGPRKLQLRMRELIKEMPEEMVNSMAQEAARITYVGTNAVEQWVQNFRRLPGMRWIIPFARVSSNILVETARRTPGVGLAELGYKAAKGAKGAELAQLASYQVIPSAAAVWTAVQVADGDITGSKPMPLSDPRYTEQPARAAGWRPYSIRIGDTYHEYKRLDPVGSILGELADLAIAWKEYEDSPPEALNTMTRSLVRLMAEPSFLGDFKEFLMDLLLGRPGKEPKSIAQFAGQFAGRFVPFSAATATYTKMFDQYERDTRGGVAQLMQGLPGLRQKLKPKKDIFERPVKREYGILARHSKINQAELNHLLRAEKLIGTKKLSSAAELKKITPREAIQRFRSVREHLARIQPAEPTRRERRGEVISGGRMRGETTGEARRQFYRTLDNLFKGEWKLAMILGDEKRAREVARESRRAGFNMSAWMKARQEELKLGIPEGEEWFKQ